MHAEIVRLIMRQGMMFTSMGLLLGVAGALTTPRLLRGLRFGVGTTDPLVLGVVALVLAATVLTAA